MRSHRDQTEGVAVVASGSRWGRKGAVQAERVSVVGKETSQEQEPAARRPSQLDLRPGLAEECAARLWTDEGESTRRYLLEGRVLPEGSIRAWDLGCLWVHVAGQRIPLLTIPVRDRAGKVGLMKYRTVPGPCPACGGSGKACSWDLCDGGLIGKRFMRSAGCPSLLYGAHRLPTDTSACVIVTEGELDVVALHAYGYTEGVVSPTTGAGSKWDDAALDLLEPYPGIWLCYDQDEAGDKGVAPLAEALGPRRCYRVRLPRKDAGDCLQSSVPADVVEAALTSALVLEDSGLHRIGGYAGEVERLISNPSELVGYPTGSNHLDRCIGGLRPGLMVVTAGSGAGKTTFCTWLCWTQARAGVPVLLTAMEQGPVGIAQKLVRMQLGGDFRRFSPMARQDAYAELDALPIHIWRQQGSAEFDEVLAAVRFARRRHGVRVALWDHLEYLLSGDPEHERHEVGKIVRSLATQGKDEGMCNILVVHPGKINPSERRRVMLTDAKLSSSIVQEAMVGLTLDRLPQAKDDPRLRTRIFVDKLRSECGGLPGSDCTLFFDFAAQRYADRPDDLPYSQDYPGTSEPSPI